MLPFLLGAAAVGSIASSAKGLLSSGPEQPKPEDARVTASQSATGSLEAQALFRKAQIAASKGEKYVFQTLKQKRKTDALTKRGDTFDIADHQTTLDFTGASDSEMAKIQATLQGEVSDLSAQGELDLMKKYAPLFEEQAIESKKRLDPDAYESSLELSKGLRADYADKTAPTEGEKSRALRDKILSSAEAGIGDEARSSALDELLLQAGMSQAGDNGDDYGLSGSAGTQEARNVALQRGLSDFNLGSSLSGEQANQMEQSVRGAAAARGQELSTSGVVQEAVSKFNLGEQMRQQRLGNLMNIGAQAFGQEQTVAGSKAALAQQKLMNLANIQAAIYGQQRGLDAQDLQRGQAEYQNLINAQGLEFSQSQAMREEAIREEQRNISNLSGRLLGMPSGQAQPWSGGPSFVPQGLQFDQNALSAGMNAASNNYNTQARLYSQQGLSPFDAFGAKTAGKLGSDATDYLSKGFTNWLNTSNTGNTPTGAPGGGVQGGWPTGSSTQSNA